MKNRLIATLVTGALAATMASAAFGQADPKNSAYWLEQYGTPDANVWRNSTGLCWRAGYWTPAMAIFRRAAVVAGSLVSPSPNRRSKTLRGLNSMGRGEVGVRQETVLV